MYHSNGVKDSMWLETLTLQTHTSRKPAIEKLYSDIKHDRDFSTTAISVFYHEDSVLYVSWHLAHKGEMHSSCSIQCERLAEMLRFWGPVHHRNWLPMKTNHPSESNLGDNYAN